MPLSDHKNNPYHNERPVVSTFSCKRNGFEAFIDLDKKNIVQSYNYITPEQSEWTAWFSYFAKSIEGMELHSAMAWENSLEESTPGAVFLPQLLLRDMGRELTATPPTHSELVKEEELELICRCFGVYRTKLIDLLQKNPEMTLKEMTDLTMVGGGCSSCIRDVKALVKEVLLKLNITPQEINSDIEVSEELQLKISKLLKVYLKHTFSELSLKDIKFSKGELHLDLSGGEYDTVEVKSAIAELILQNFKLSLEILL